MGLVQMTIVLLLSATACLATYGPHDGPHSDGPRKVHIDSPKIHLDSPRIHLESPKILLERPKIQYSDAHSIYGDDEPIVYESERPLYVRKAHYGVHSSTAALAPLIINGGYGGYGHAHAASAHGKVLNVAGPVVVAPSPIYHDGPILVRRPVVVAKELFPTQDHLEKQHYDKYHGSHSLAAVKAALAEKAILAEKAALAEKALYYDGHHAPLHSLGHGLVRFSAYQHPVLLGHPRSIVRSHGGLIEKDIHAGTSAYVKKY